MMRAKIGMSDFILGSQQALDEARRVLNRPMPGCRFDLYLRVMGEMAKLTYPSRFPWPDDSQKRQLFFEAVSQLQGLQYWPSVLASASAEAKREKLSRVLGGKALPDYFAQRDPARDALAEIVVGHALGVQGFQITFSERDEDMLAEHRDCLPLVVEVKRPSSDGNKRAIQDGYKQLESRDLSPKRLGMLVIALDRRLETGGKTWAASNVDAFQSDFERIVTAQSNLRKFTEVPLRRTVFAPFFGVMVHMPIFFQADGIAFSATQLAVESTNTIRLVGATRLAHAIGGAPEAVTRIRTVRDWLRAEHWLDHNTPDLRSQGARV
ncbi:MAG TPA: hypothetical protein VFS67_30110 [Polyangiaceae bacterium]|nr:hypothetical protein [Polyangiaceae bacterium]